MSNRLRRDALMMMAVGAPIIWAKPVVDSVILPVHAVTSCGTFLICDGTQRLCTSDNCPEERAEHQRLVEAGCINCADSEEAHFGTDGDNYDCNCEDP